MLSLLASSAIASPAPPVIKRPNEIYIATIEGGGPATVDPAWSYDTASGELISNIYEPLIYFDGERLDTFVPMLAKNVPDFLHVPNAYVENITGVELPPPLNSVLNSPYNPGWQWKPLWKITFEIRTGVKFHDGPWGSGYTLTPQDVEYSLERCLVQNRRGGPTWMHYEMLFGTGIYSPWYMGNLADETELKIVGQMLDYSVQSNSTHVWLITSMGSPKGPSQAILQILAQTWGGILSKQWINDYVIGTLGRIKEWPGTWGDYSYDYWLKYRRPSVSPLDAPTPIACGTGPFKFTTWDKEQQYWQIDRFADYWGGWPAKFPAPPYPTGPAPAHIPPKGYVSTVKETWAYDWPARRAMFLAGDVDFCAVPREYRDQILGQNGIRCMYPLPTLAVDAMFFQFVLADPSVWTPPAEYKILPEGTFDESGFPRDFFSNPTWGEYVRKAFAFAFDYDTAIQTAMLGEAIRPATALISGLTLGPGVPYVPLPPSASPYKYNLTKAGEYFKLVPGLWNTGFTILVAYNTDSPFRVAAANLIKTAIESLNPKFHVITYALDWDIYLDASLYGELPYWLLGWLADFPDVHNFAFPFYHSEGDFGGAQGYHNPTVDNIIETAAAEINPSVRQNLYRQLEQIILQECPSVTTVQGIGRHFERDWIVGWYYNQITPGLYAYPIWKGYYTPHKLLDNAIQPWSGYLPFDIDYSGSVTMDDIGFACLAFGSSFGPPIHPRWNFRADVDNNRQVDMTDIGWICLYFGR
jgi:peptide/nickel transport system substrate-binding protein